ncbi:carbohydrate porin [Psychromonas sp.]|uniref:carbohydrate porin n=1 Tax=Psychromonas sp. TaxID=1884585 RepID=UPI003561E2F3
MKKQILAPSILALFVASAAHAGATFDTAAGTLNLGADVEFDYTSQGGEKLDNGAIVSADVNFEAKGRLLLDINGEKVLDNGNFAGFKLNPVWGQNGSRGADDVWIKFGQKDNWNIQAGHFEATDLSSAGQDTYIAESGTLMYRASEARGRTADDSNGDGQVTFTKTLDAANFELTAQSRDSGDYVIVRPAVTFAAENVSVAFGAEVPVVDSADLYDWFGLGATATVQATDDLALTVRAALLEDKKADTQSYTAGLNAQYQNFFIAALYGETDTQATTAETQVYASYKIPGVLDIDNFDIYLGAGWSEAEVLGTTLDDVFGGRVRLKYVF